MSAPDAHPADQPTCPSAESGERLLPDELRAWMVLLAATGAMEQRLRVVVKETLDVSHDEFLILCLLAERPRTGLRMTQVADLLGRPKTRLTYQIACLQRAGLVNRRSVCGDKRGVEVVLTDRARELLRETSALLAGTVRQALADSMGADQRAAMCALIPDLAGLDAGRAAR
ncbi:MarR family winged helix-turn-helix transcriptional regulator [Streptomyces sp. MMG1121]|uniref:MarR family winged helix-turn-helix transcriptional regulator n=1 Tax=Streptomyces sp. MMG1121 TaxID=1415544 RepID=UPI0006AF4597|nr:MarR family transcriptional regulator [Streptomyces sp. MMG1121]KOV69173.1 MarR family transcriptional regulator [Streptomyces sp. MMG1121]